MFKKEKKEEIKKIKFEEPTEEELEEDTEEEEFDEGEDPEIPELPDVQPKAPKRELTDEEELEALKQKIADKERAIEEDKARAIEEDKAREESKILMKPVAVPVETMFNSLSDRLDNLEVAMQQITTYLRSK